MRYGSVCSGIEAATVAWEPLGWKAAWFAEIEKFPSAVLAARWPEVENLGDMTKIAAAVRAGEVESPDVIVGGTPCQAFSIAGLRNGLADARGQLTLSYVELADAIDDKRRKSGEEEAIFVWENVPGVLSSKDNAFGCFIGALAGEDCELQPAGGKWSNAGCVYGPSRIVAWRVLDAQFFGVAQRRRRVFVVASARNGFDPAAVLFELDSVRRDTPPSRCARTATAGVTGNSTNGHGATANLITMAHGQGGAEIKTDNSAPTLTCNHEAPILAISFAENSKGEVRIQNGDGQITGPLSAGGGKPGQGYPAVITEPYTLAIRGRADGSSVEVRNDGTANALLTPNGGRGGIGVGAIGWGMQVRRLTPVECERLQGFPDNYTLISWKKKEAMNCPDSHRYKALGNSMAVPVMRWIGERIAAAMPEKAPAPRAWQRPFLKWAGGKYSLLSELDRFIPAGKRLIEPFVGGGSVFINSDKHASFLLADVNPDLINLYQMMVVAPEGVISSARKLFNLLTTEEDYLALRAEFNGQCLDAVERAGALLYLNRHCFNGLIRYNLAGIFNVGWGKYKSPYFPEAELCAFSSVAHNCVFMNAGFQKTLSLAGEGDVVYCDPPYEPLPGTSGFTGYAAGGFKWADQVALAESCVAAHQRGAAVVISNSTAPKVIDLYESHGFRINHVTGRRSISSKGATRDNATDIIATLGVKL